MDIKMPEVNGLDATRYIMHIKPSMPIIAITAYAMESDKKLCFEAGCIDYICKPVMHERLIHVMNKFLQRTAKSVNTGA
jgi:CheY-like chemotaxis protein